MSKPTLGGFLYSGNAGTGMPNASVLGRIGQFAMCGIYGTGAGEPYTVQWSAIGDIEDWPTPGTTDARTKQAGQQAFPGEFGKVTGIVGNDFYGYIFQERAIHKATYVGGDVVFAFDTIIDDIGCIDYDRFTKANEVVYFESEFGYHSIVNDQINNIGFGRVDRTYTPTVRQDAEDNSQVTKSVADNLIFFEDQKLFYNYKTDQWTRVSGYYDEAAYYDAYVEDEHMKAFAQPSGAKTGTYRKVTMGDGVYQLPVFTTKFYEINPDGRAYVDAIRVKRSGGAGSNLTSATIAYSNDVRDMDGANSSLSTTENSRTQKIHFRDSTQGPVGRFLAVSVIYNYTGTASTVNAFRGVDVWIAPTGKD